MQDEHNNQPAAPTPYPGQGPKLISSKFVPETKVQRASSAKQKPDEKIIYRNVNLFDMNEKTLDRCSTCSRSSSRNFGDQDRSNCCPNCHTMIKPISRTLSRCRGTTSQSQISRPKPQRKDNRFKNPSQNDIDWNNLNERIEDWFEVAKTPEQRVVYKFLKEIKDENYEDQSCMASLAGSLDDNGNNVQSLEDILDNLKKYRHKMSRKRGGSRAGSRAPPANVGNNLPYIKSDLLTHYPDNLDKAFESSTWRVMRHVKSADIRNRYPLPKANPDYHFGNSSVFFTAGRAPKSTFLLHPDWV